MGRVEPTQTALAIAMTKGTGLYPRDLLMRQMSGGIYDIFDENGRNYQVRQRFTETVVFQGVILELTASLSLPSGVGVFPDWPLPVLDTAGFWDLLNPKFITIPAGINVVELFAGATTTGTTALFEAAIFAAVLPLPAESTGQGFNVNAKNAITGPITVNPGDQFRVRFTSSNANATRTDRRAFFALNVLDAD